MCIIRRIWRNFWCKIDQKEEEEEGNLINRFTNMRRKFNFVACFKNETEELKYIEWKRKNNVEQIYFQLLDLSFPRKYSIVLFVDEKEIEFIKNSSWFVY